MNLGSTGWISRAILPLPAPCNSFLSSGIASSSGRRSRRAAISVLLAPSASPSRRQQDRQVFPAERHRHFDSFSCTKLRENEKPQGFALVIDSFDKTRIVQTLHSARDSTHQCPAEHSPGKQDAGDESVERQPDQRSRRCRKRRSRGFSSVRSSDVDTGSCLFWIG
jgi:hypothetical protein